MNAAGLTTQALLNCLFREVSSPDQLFAEEDGWLVIRLARSGALLRAALRRPSAGLGPRLAGTAELRRDGSWQPVDWAQLARMIAAELTLASGAGNPEFAGQVRDSHHALVAILESRQDLASRQDPAFASGGPSEDTPIGRYLASEQSLAAGHRFHPAPKARPGHPRQWLRYAPEAGARFPLRFLGVRAGALAGAGDTSVLDRLGGPPVPPGYRVLPAHPWQLHLLARQPWLRQALRQGDLLDLGEGAGLVVPTSSVRTVYDPAADVFCKFSLSVRITNCVRTSAWYELAGSVALTGLLAPVAADLADCFPGTVLLGEPGYRTVTLPAGGTPGPAQGTPGPTESLAVIVREGLRDRLRPGVTPLLAASLTEPPVPGPPPPGQQLFGGRDTGWLLDWWEAYLRHVAGPVLHAFFRHGVVLEPHLQNVLIGVDPGGLPVQAVFRDLEGVKLDPARHSGWLSGLAPGVGRPMAYDRERGWNRVAYCLFVNHLAELAAAIADQCPGREQVTEAGLWRVLSQVLAKLAADHGWQAPELHAVLAGQPLPAKANLRLRWSRAADRAAEYLPVPHPMRQEAGHAAP